MVGLIGVAVYGCWCLFGLHCCVGLGLGTCGVGLACVCLGCANNVGLVLRC